MHGKLTIHIDAGNATSMYSFALMHYRVAK